MQRRRDQQPLFAFDLPTPTGPNLTDHGPNRARMNENDPLKDSARRCTETRSARGSLPAYGSTNKSHLWTTRSPT
ncbi:hypothetical protein F511_38701 [Dorcoceras hygrometricum]|uniref:Uncharacterized protein n=1 Tax=Dorcoceras hygrometricum TaxID=472368 RepID=A0A2Z7B484_9LAMI|nr:hypothetical protein F511_38701 [Dorcoceras hygrometricum]